MTARRVVVTGCGVIAPGGIGTKDFWQLITSGRTATRTISFFDPSPFRSQVAAECDFDAAAEGLTPQETRRVIHDDWSMGLPARLNERRSAS
jgi:minimal PKS ketosynthase (KS/KS alpha)